MDLISQSVTLSKLVKYFFSQHKLKIILYVSICIFFGAIPAIDSYLLKKIINLLEYDDSSFIASQFMLYIALIYGIWWEGLNVISRIYDYVFLSTFPYIKGSIIAEFYNKVQLYDNNFFENHFVGNISSRITDAAKSFEMCCAIFFEKIVRKISEIFFTLLALYYVNLAFAGIFLSWILIFNSINLFFSKRIKFYSVKYAQSRSHIAGNIVDSLLNISFIRMLSKFNFELQYHKQYINKMIVDDKVMQWFMLKLRYALGFSCSLMVFIVIYYIFKMRIDNSIDVGDCVLIITLYLAVVNDVWDLSQEVGDMFEELGILIQSIKLIDTPLVRKNYFNKNLLICHGTIKFDNVYFNYKTQFSLFKNLSLVIEGKQKIGIVGYSGAGKSTLINLITRLYDVDSGKIYIDDQDISLVNIDSLRTNISIIPQQCILFNRSIMENIKYAKQDATYEEIIKSAKLAYIDDFISQLPDGYNTLCTQHGSNLSGGQRQRIIIARAILHNAPILILDEATSSLDAYTENMIKKSLVNLMENKTVLIIAHKLTTLLSMDRILVFDAGKIVGDGTHSELLNNCDMYKKLWKYQ